MNSNQIIDLVKVSIPEAKRQSVEKLNFYGSGCSTIEKCTTVRTAMEKLFPNAEVIIESDILGTAIALFGKSKGVACILGTGSNAAVYDGTKFIDQIKSLGYLLGDEGSGAYIGKHILHDYLHETMPENLRIKFNEQYPTNMVIILHRLYKQDFPNRYLADFAPFASANRGHDYIENLLKKAFNAFIRFQLDILTIDKFNCEIGFVGSVAFNFQDVLTECLQQHGYQVGKIIKTPLEALVKHQLELFKK
jgi:N-acetylglucosamine kinase-like BadF-type ATPase